jgi:hypothetical protein
VAQAETVELRASALLDVPVVADRFKYGIVRVAGRQRLERVENRSYAQHAGHAALRHERQRLRQVADGAVDGDRGCGEPVFACDQLEQRALSHVNDRFEHAMEDMREISRETAERDGLSLRNHSEESSDRMSSGYVGGQPVKYRRSISVAAVI